MKIVLVLSVFLILRAKAWSSVRVPFEFLERQAPVHIISDCMHVASEEGDYSFKKVLHMSERVSPRIDKTVCGLYVLTDPDKIVEISIKYLDVNCNAGGLMAFFDGWELNQQYFPNAFDHHIDLEHRFKEFCNDNAEWPFKQLRKKFRSSQNAALLQYRIPLRGSFVASVRFIENPEPCNIMVEGTAPFYKLTNFNSKKNCSITAMFPAVVSLKAVDIGGAESKIINYDCGDMRNRLDIGGSKDLDTSAMEVSSSVCGHSNENGPGQAIMCGVTTVRLLSNGNHNNEALVTIRSATVDDIDIATVICPE